VPVLAKPFLPLVLIPAALGLARIQAQKPANTEKTDQIAGRLTISIDMSMQERWFHSPAEMGVDLAEATTVVRGQPFAPYVFFSHWTVHNQTEIGVDYDIRITKPSGGLYRADEKLEGHSGSPGQEKILLADQILRLAFEPTDALGKYVFTVTVRDRASTSTATVKKTLELVEYAEGTGIEDKKAFDAWYPEYYRAQHPERAIPALLDMGRLGAWKAGAESALAAAFFQEIFASNAWLMPLLLKRFDTQDVDTKRMILRVLAGTGFDGQAFVVELKGADAEMWKQVSAEPRHDLLIDPVNELKDLDELWGTFHASGKFMPFQRLCEALVSEQTGVIAAGADAAALKTAAAASIRRKARDHALVRNYCDWIQTSETMPESVRQALKQALGSK
jgi:hypothetical protein